MRIAVKSTDKTRLAWFVIREVGRAISIVTEIALGDSRDNPKR